MDLIIGDNLVASTFVCFKAARMEYGYAFKKPGSPDTLFDITLGECLAGDSDTSGRAWRSYEWAARAIVDAAPKLD